VKYCPNCRKLVYTNEVRVPAQINNLVTVNLRTESCAECGSWIGNSVMIEGDPEELRGRLDE